MGPYRTEEREERAAAPRDPGLVADIIAQFADPLAFYRELVQNAIDAGSAAIEVRLEHDGAAGVLRASVRDRGEGMTRELLEEQLLVLFRSTKERDETKIGKFGIGFASVLAPEPRIVVVQTARDGRRLTVHLHPDLTYQLFDAGPATHAGTTVTLELALATEAAVAFVERSRRALVRWCRHAAVPIRLEATVPAAGLAIAEAIDRPLGFDDALVEIRGEADGGALVAVVGIRRAGAKPYLGCFNHGLTLHESEEPILGNLAVKLQDARLGHTLSRDNVRRDERFERAVAFARELAARQLVAAAAAALRAAASAGPARGDDYHELAEALAWAGVELRAEEWTLPLVEPIGGARAALLSALGRIAWAAPAPGPVTAALARARVPVIRAPAHRLVAIARRAQPHGCLIAAVADALTLVAPVEPAPGDEALLGELRDALEAAHRAPSEVVLAQLAGAAAGELAIGAGPGDAIHEVAPGAAYVIEREAARRNPFALLRRPPLVLSAAHPMVDGARRHADPRLAAAHLARAVLLHYRLLDGDRSEAILAHALGRLGVG